MDRTYIPVNSIVDVPYKGEWVAGAAIKKGEFRTYGGLLFMANVAHTSTAATAPYADPAVIYARVFKGAYDAATTYAKYDGVSYAGAGFFSRIEDNLGNTPPSDGTSNDYWYCYAQRGTQGPKGDAATGATNWSMNEVPSGAMDGVNQTFTLAHTPAGQILLVFTGSVLDEGAADDYTVSGTTITLNFVHPNSAVGDKLLAFYPY
jgi:hypothetical protein